MQDAVSGGTPSGLSEPKDPVDYKPDPSSKKK